MIINESNIDKKPDSICSFPLQEAPDNSQITELLPESTSTGINLREFPVYGDNVTNVLWQRWIACYLLYDWTPKHADNAFCNNGCMWVDQILHEDVEDFIQTHMRVWKCDRSTVEFQIAKTIAEIFVEKE